MSQDRTFEVEIEKLPVAVLTFGGFFFAGRYEWKLWETNGDDRWRPRLPEPLDNRGLTFTRWGAQREARRSVRKSESYWSRESEYVPL